jgi:fructokinase
VRLLSIGEILWDLIGGRRHLGGAPFNLAVHARRLGHEVVFVSAVGDDDLGRAALSEARRLGIGTESIATVATAPTGTVTVSLDQAGQPAFTLHRPAAYDRIPARPVEFEPDWICFGTLAQTAPAMRGLTRELTAAHPGARRFYDVNLRPDCYTRELVAELMAEADGIKVNDAEAGELGLAIPPGASLPRVQAMCVTRGAAGCSVWVNGEYTDCPGYPIVVADTVGAGDAFSAAFLHGLSQGWPAERVGDFANRVGALVASRRGATPDWTAEEARGLQAAYLPDLTG